MSDEGEQTPLTVTDDGEISSGSPEARTTSAIIFRRFAIGLFAMSAGTALIVAREAKRNIIKRDTVESRHEENLLGLIGQAANVSQTLNGIYHQLADKYPGEASQNATEKYASGVAVKALSNAEHMARSIIADDRGLTEPELGKLLYIACVSAPLDTEKRSKIREAWMDRLQKEHGNHVRAEFVVGHKPMGGMKDCQAPKADQEMEKDIEKERMAYGDIARVPCGETRGNLPIKIFQAFELGVDAHYSFIMKVDDDVEPDIVAIIDYLKNKDPAKGLFLELAAPTHGTNRNRRAYLLNSALAHQITKVHRFDNLGYLKHGSLAEDANMERWIARENKTNHKVAHEIQPFVRDVNGVRGTAPKSHTDSVVALHARKDDESAEKLSPDPEKLLYIAVVSAPSAVHLRSKARVEWVTQLRQKYGKEVKTQFILGQNSMPGDHVQYEDQFLEMMIEQENAEYGDITRIPLPETIQNLPDKAFSFLRLGVDAGYKFIMKVDVDFTPLYMPLIHSLREKDPEDGFYLDCVHIHKALQYFTQIDSNQDYTKMAFGAGVAYVLSFGLAYRITKVHASESLSYLAYGSTAEDIVVRKWVEREKSMGYNISSLNQQCHSMSKTMLHPIARTSMGPFCTSSS